jgi:PhnB protein
MAAKIRSGPLVNQDRIKEATVIIASTRCPGPHTKEEAAMAVKPIPEGQHSITPYLVVQGADKLIQFLEQGLGGKLVERHQGPDGKTAHAEVKIGDSIVMLGEANERAKAYSAMLYHYVPNIDETYQRALAAGATSLVEPMNMFYGDRSGAVADPCGNSWHLATHIEDVSPEEMQKRMQALKK